MKKNKLILLTLIGCLSFLLVYSSAISAQYRFGLAVSTLNNPFFINLREGAQMKADQLGIELVIIDSQNDEYQQNSSIEDLIAQQIDIIIVNPVDSETIISAIETANQAAVPIITVDRSAFGGEVETHIASDNVEGGRIAARFIVEQLDEEGEIIELKGIPGTSTAAARSRGFNEVINEYMGVEVVAREPAGFSRADGVWIMESFLISYPDIKAVFAHNDLMALGAVEAIETAKKLDQITVVGFDAIEDARDAIREGKIAATIAQKPFEMGIIAVETAHKIMIGEMVEEFISVPLKLVTTENVGDL